MPKQVTTGEKRWYAIHTYSGYEENVKRNLELTRGLIMTEHVMNGLVKKGMPRQEAHEFLRNCSAEVIKTGKSLREVLQSKGISKYFTETELNWYLDPKNYIGNAVKQVETAVAKLKA